MLKAKIANQARKLAAGEIELFGGPRVSEALAGRFRAEQIAGITRYTITMMVANITNASIVLKALLQQVQSLAAYLWAFSIITVSAYIGVRQLLSRASSLRKTASVRAMHRAAINAFILGTAWATLSLFFFTDATESTKIIILTVTIGMICGGAFTLAPLPIAGISFLMPLAFAAGIALVLAKEPVYLLVVGLLVVYTFVLLRAMNSYAAQFATRFLAELENEKVALCDSLTKLPNRTAFESALASAAARSQRFGEKYALLYLDLDKFKDINDGYGHPGGDDYLVQVAERLQMCLRQSDVAARVGGDEFAILASNIQNPEDAAAVAERVLKAFRAPFIIDGAAVQGDCSVGVALMPEDADNPEQLTKQADAALYTAKNGQRGSFKFFEPFHETQALRRRELESDLRIALAENQFHLVFQPFVDATTLRTTGYEALLRWEHPVRGLIPPVEFIQIAERIGLIHEIGEWVLRHAISAATKWPNDLRVAINVSTAQFRSMEIVSIVRDALRVSGLQASRVELEITETLILGELERAEMALNGLNQLGVLIALDDFGTGYSSLTHLINLPVQRLKIDKSFIAGMLESKKSETLVRSVIMLAAQLGIGVTAEGVETQAQFEYLRELCCDEVQGYLISRPVKEDMILKHCPTSLAA